MSRLEIASFTVGAFGLCMKLVTELKTRCKIMRKNQKLFEKLEERLNSIEKKIKQLRGAAEGGKEAKTWQDGLSNLTACCEFAEGELERFNGDLEKNPCSCPSSPSAKVSGRKVRTKVGDKLRRFFRAKKSSQELERIVQDIDDFDLFLELAVSVARLLVVLESCMGLLGHLEHAFRYMRRSRKQSQKLQSRFKKVKGALPRIPLSAPEDMSKHWRGELHKHWHDGLPKLAIFFASAQDKLESIYSSSGSARLYVKLRGVFGLSQWVKELEELSKGMDTLDGARFGF